MIHPHRTRLVTAPLAALFAVSCSADNGAPVPRGDAGVHSDAADASGARDVTTGPCVDTDMDHIAASYETAGESPGEMGGGDSDGDGFTDLDEGVSNYPGFASGRTLTCGSMPDDCDADGLSNFLDTDSDNDGLTDADEAAARTNPCNADTDGDMVDDLTEHVAGSDPTDAQSMPPASSLYVTLPYHPPGETGMHPTREFPFATHIREADVFFLIDNSESMSNVIANLRTNFSSSIVPGLHAAIPDLRIGVGSFDSMPDGRDGAPGRAGHPGDYTFWVRQRLDAMTGLSQLAFDTMHTIDADTSDAFFGGDAPEDSTEAAYEAIAGDGTPGHATDEAARRSVHNALDPTGNGWVARMDPVLDCAMTPDDPVPYGWACFRPGRVPILVLTSDAGWYNGYSGTPADPNSHTYPQLRDAILAHGGFFIGIDDGSGRGGPTWNNSIQLAMDTHTVDGAGAPIVFGPGVRGIPAVADQVVQAITTIAQQSHQDITTHSTGVTTGTPSVTVTSGHTTADFIKAVTPTRGIPEAPAGYDRRDATTFYNVAPSTQVVFTVDFYNDFQMPGPTAQVFQATIHVLGRGGTEVDHRDVYIVVPSAGGGPPG